MPPIASLEDMELRWLHAITCDLHSALVETVVRFVDDAWFGAGLVVLAMLVVALTKAGRARVGPAMAILLLTLGAVHGVREILWRTVPRERPGGLFQREKGEILRGPLELPTCGEHPEKWVERAHPPGAPSFPSSHVVTAGACAVGLFAAARWAGVLGWIYALLVGWGRLYQGKHWPSDVVGSLLLAAALGWLCGRLVARLRTVRDRRGAGTDPPNAGPSTA